MMKNQKKLNIEVIDDLKMKVDSHDDKKPKTSYSVNCFFSGDSQREILVNFIIFQIQPKL